MKKFPIFIQRDVMDCGASCVKMITDYHKTPYPFEEIKSICSPTREGVSLSNISDCFDELGYKTLGGRITIERLIDNAPLPCILHWNQEHFVVLTKIKKTKKETYFYVADPGVGMLKFTKQELLENWCSTKCKGEDKGVILMAEQKSDFKYEDRKEIKNKGFSLLIPYFLKYKKYFGLLFLGLLIGSFIQLFFPFLTKSLVDVGIKNKNISFINTVLIAQLVLLISKMCMEFVQNWILLHISTRVNISMLSDFLIKLMKLPMNYFDTKMTGDVLQRFEDHKRLEHFITTQSIMVIYAFVNFIVFGVTLCYFNKVIFGVFLTGSLLYIGWLLLFMDKRKVLDYQMFEQRATNDTKTFQIIQGMQEMKLQGSTQRMRWEWEDVQAKLFDVNVKLLKLKQSQKIGSVFINETKNIIITFISAYAVITGDLSLGVMIAIQFIIGQLSLPIEQIAQFVYNIQDAKISMERIADIKNKENENKDRHIKKINETDRSISIQNLSFNYVGSSHKVLKNISLDLKKGTTTAIVGASGSGKTTLIKLLLQYYKVKEGIIKIGSANINDINSDTWRKRCGTVMQDGYIFSDTIAKNIAISEDIVDLKKLDYASRMANLDEFVNKLPLKYNTKIGQEGVGLSQGQKQRILIARAIYKMPKYLFLDEATNSLDASNEKEISDRLENFMKERTVLIVAHRLSTVKNADNIIVLDNGEIIEKGTHNQLVNLKGYYYNLIKNQLELGT